MNALLLTLSWEEQLLQEAEKDLRTAEDTGSLALSVWAVAQLAYGRLCGVSALEGFHADPSETYRGLAEQLGLSPQLERELCAVYQVHEQVGQGASALSDLLNEPLLRELGSHLLRMLRGAKQPEAEVVPAIFHPARRAAAGETEFERTI